MSMTRKSFLARLLGAAGLLELRQLPDLGAAEPDEASAAVVTGMLLEGPDGEWYQWHPQDVVQDGLTDGGTITVTIPAWGDPS